MGSLVKTHLSAKLNVAREKIYHLTVMPCFDKKLEASRENFKDDVTGSADVDLVITAVELEQVSQVFYYSEKLKSELVLISDPQYLFSFLIQ